MNSKNGEAPMGDCSSPSGLDKDVSNEQYSIGVNTDTRNAPELKSSLSKEAETKALELLRQAGFSFIQELDWLAKSPSGKWITVEVKAKSRLFHPPPFWGLGLDQSQVFLRKKACEEHSFRCFLLVFCGDAVYGQYLDTLMAGRQYFTDNGIVVFPIDAYIKGEAILKALKDT